MHISLHGGPWQHPGSAYLRISITLMGWYAEVQFSLLRPERINAWVQARRAK